MSRTAPVEMLPTNKQDKDKHKSAHGLRPIFPRKRLFIAFALAVLSDCLSLLLSPTPPLQWTSDFVTAVLLFLVLGRQWILLPGLIMEAIPGIYILPFWVFVVVAIAIWGTPRPTLKGTFRPRN